MVKLVNLVAVGLKLVLLMVIELEIHNLLTTIFLLLVASFNIANKLVIMSCLLYKLLTTKFFSV